MSIKLSAELVAPCGMNCGVCKRYLATVRGRAGVRGLPACKGCRPQRRQCAFVKKSCDLLRKDRIRFCFECGDFPCGRLDTLNCRYTTRYRTSLIDNLISIQKTGMEKWLAGEEKRWRCEECGGTVSIHDLTCYDCGSRRPT